MAPPTPEGVYEVVAVRAASDVARSVPGPEDFALIGRRMTFGREITWFDGRACLAPSVRASVEPWRNLDEPNMSDLQASAKASRRRLNATLVIDCGGRACGEITPVLMVDRRTLVVRIGNETAYAVLGRPLDRRTALAVERGLARKGFDPGAVDGLIDAVARRAVALYAQSRGARYAFQSAALTDALVGELTR